MIKSQNDRDKGDINGEYTYQKGACGIFLVMQQSCVWIMTVST